MARKRMLSPEFFSSAPVSRLPIPAMITFAGLWCYLDDYGRGEDDPALVKAAVWPRRKVQTEAKVAADLDAIAAQELICRYTEGGSALIHSPSWNEHQKISHKTPSRLPPCPAHEPDEYSAYLRQRGDGRDRFRNASGNAPESSANNSARPPPLARVPRATRGGVETRSA
jgi:hypothetical protein